MRDGVRSVLGGGKPSGPLQPRVVTAENDLQLQQEKIKNILLSTSLEHKNKLLDGFSSQLDLNPVKHHRDLMQMNEGKTPLLDGHLADLPPFMVEKV